MKIVQVLGSAALAMAALVGSVQAQMTPVGLWKTIDDKTGAVRSEVRIVEKAGALSGVIEKALIPSPEPNCDQCSDDRKGKPKLGLEIIRGAVKAEGKDVWEGGSIVDPDNGTVYKLRMTPIEGGAKLEVRGFIGFALLGRTQTWFRVP
jgi:uncharacterized protein (DUF2147 family)